MLQNKKMQSGFTLVELMITIGILAILAAIAYPSYQNFIIRGRMEAARSDMVDSIRNMEKHYETYRTMCAITKGAPELDSSGKYCSRMPTANAVNAEGSKYETKILRDDFNLNTGTYLVGSEPKAKVYSDSTLNNKEVYLLYYSSGSGFVKCNKNGYEQASSGKDVVDGCSVM